MHKRSLTISGHRTSIALEPRFWSALEDMASARNLSLPALIARIDDNRTDTNLSSAIRVAVLEWALSHSSEGSSANVPGGNTVTD